jgi:hypothetical protein
MTPVRSTLAALLAFGAVMTPAPSSLADDDGLTSADLAALGAGRDETGTTTGMAEFGVGLLTLPGAVVCTQSSNACGKGDSSLTFEAWPLFRRGHFAAGAGVVVGTTSSTSTPPNTTPDVPRDHFRRYLTIEATARYYVPLGGRFEAWGGITGGLVVVNDTYQSQNGLNDLALVGPRGATILTEGATFGVALGLGYAFAQHWRIGTGARVSQWLLPHTPENDPLEDPASLTGRVTAVQVDLTLSYRSRLVF